MEASAQGAHVNYYVLTVMFAFIIFFSFANAYEPQIDAQIDFFDISLPIAQFVTGIFGLYVAKKYGWSTHIFGRAYLALSLGFLIWGVGSTVFLALIVSSASVPYPGLPDVFFVITYLLLLFHLSTIVRYFKRNKFSGKDKLVLIAIPVVINIVYVMAVFLVPSIPGSVPDLLSNHVIIGGQLFEIVEADGASSEFSQITVDNATFDLVPVDSYTGYPQIPETEGPVDLVPIVFTKLTTNFETASYTPGFWPPFFAGLFYNSITTVNLALAILGMTVFRGSMLGTAWGVLLVGFILISSADIVYDFTSLYGDVRTSLAIPLWVFGCMILSYALYLHRKHI